MSAIMFILINLIAGFVIIPLVTGTNFLLSQVFIHQVKVLWYVKKVTLIAYFSTFAMYVKGT